MIVDARLVLRVTMICCQAWGISPHKFGKLASRGRVSIEQVIEAVMLTASTSAFSDMITYLQPEVAAATRARNERIAALAQQYRGTKDKEVKARLLAEIRHIQMESDSCPRRR